MGLISCLLDRSMVGTSTVLLCAILCPAVAWGQPTGGIAGSVTDGTGSVLPGVTVEARSPALIEGVRGVVTEGAGRYAIEALRPGVYSVTFALAGFSTFVREGIEVTSGFTANVDAQLMVGSIEEKVTVSGASPLVDVQNTVQQNVLTNERLDALPTASQAPQAIMSLIPGMTGVGDVGGASGIATGNAMWRTVYHGKGAIDPMWDGTNFETWLRSAIFSPNPINAQETVVQSGGVSADVGSAGMVFNWIPKDGGNSFTGIVSGLFTNASLQSNNLDDSLRARGVSSTNRVLYLYDASVGVGGRIKRDTLWFYGSGRVSGTSRETPGVYFNATQGTPVDTPDLTRAAHHDEFLRDGGLRLTWKASQRNKISVYTSVEYIERLGRGEFASPEAALGQLNWPIEFHQVTWSSPVSNRLLLEAAASYTQSPFPFPSPGTGFMRVGPNDISILEASTGFRYNADSQYNDPRTHFRYGQRFSLSYVTGSQSFKTGFQMEEGGENFGNQVHGNVNYTFFNGRPLSITEYATPYYTQERARPLGLYAQHQWTLHHLTTNVGLRFDSWNGSVPAQSDPATPLLPARSYASVSGVPAYWDFNPRLGAAYDLFGDGKTALKVSLARYVAKADINLASAINPVNTVLNTTRTWNDANGNFIPDCNLPNPLANGECGQIDNLNFGGSTSITQYADQARRGSGTRTAIWDLAAQVQHQLRPGVSINGGYYRNWTMNFLATKNLAVTPADYNPYCITAPLDLRLPGGGGYQVCGLYDIQPAKFGMVNNLVTKASNFYPSSAGVNCDIGGSFAAGQVVRNSTVAGAMCGTSDFFGVGFDARLGSRLLFGGGVDTGRTVLDNCYVVNSPQQLLNCRVVVPFQAQTQVKLHASYRLPYDIGLSAIFQNLAGPEIEANYLATNAQVAPSLGRDLAACRGAAVCNATVTVPLIKPLTQWEPRHTQIDLRVSKRFTLGPGTFLAANLDVYNALNSNAVLGLNQAYGRAWLNAINAGAASEAYLGGRSVQFSGKLDF